MDEFHRHLKVADEIYALSRQVDHLIEQSYRLKCDKKEFRNPYDVIPFTKYLCLDTKPRQQLTVYPCLFKYCMESLVACVGYKHPTLKASKVYYCVQERVDDKDITFFDLSDGSSYTDDDIKIFRSIAGRVLIVVNTCINMYRKHTSLDHSYLTSMRKERHRIKRLLV